MNNYDECIIFLLAKAYQKAHGHFKKRLQEFGLTPIQHLILETLWEEEGQSAREIGRKLTLDGATLSGVLDRLAEGGWIIKETDQNDKRYLRIFLSDQARDVRPRLVAQREAANEEILQNLSLEEKILLKRLLRDVQG
jgi:DNA-binding MarR family transcriptional regulator